MESWTSIWVVIGLASKHLLILLQENAVAAALHIYACRVLQRRIECCGAATSDVVDILLQPGACRYTLVYTTGDL